MICSASRPRSWGLRGLDPCPTVSTSDVRLAMPVARSVSSSPTIWRPTWATPLMSPPHIAYLACERCGRTLSILMIMACMTCRAHARVSTAVHQGVGCGQRRSQGVVPAHCALQRNIGVSRRRGTCLRRRGVPRVRSDRPCRCPRRCARFPRACRSCDFRSLLDAGLGGELYAA